MSDDKLRRELKALGYTAGPITDSTRKVLEKKLQKLRAEAKKSQNSIRSGSSVRRRGEQQQPADDSEEDDTADTDTSDWRRPSHRPYQPAKERESLGYVREEGSSWRRDSPRHGESSWSLGSRTDDGGKSAFSQGRASLLGNNTARSSLGYSASGIPESSTLRSNRYASDMPARSSLGYPSYTGDIPDRSSLGYTRHEGDIPDRSSLGYTRHEGDIPDRNFLGYTRHTGDSSLGDRSYASDIPDRSSIGYNRHISDAPQSSTLTYNRYARDIPERSFLDYSRYSTEDLRHRPISDWRTGTALDSLSHQTYSAQKKEKFSQSKPAWSKKLEHYLSKLLRVLCVILVVVFTGILIMKSGILSTSQDNGMKLLPSDCEGRGDPFCKAKQKEITLQILSELYDFLSLQAGSYECGNPSGLSSKCIPINRAKEHVMNVSGYASEKFDLALDWILSSDRHLGIWAKGEDNEKLVSERADIFCVESSRPRLGFVCRLKNALYTAVSNLFLALLGIFFLWMMMIFLRYHWQRLEEEEKQMFVMIEKIIDVVKQHYKDYNLGREQNPYVGSLHVRDSLIMPKERKPLKRVWDRAVQFIEDNESRVRTEVQRVAGADLRVWRWTETRNEHLR